MNITFIILILIIISLYIRHRNKKKKIAFCFLIYDKIHNEELWYRFFKNIDPNKYNIYIHYKINTPLKYFEQYKLNNPIPTEYGDISLVKAHRLLFREALKDKDNYKFINVSNSCFPMKSFNHIYNELTKDNKGHFIQQSRLMIDHIFKELTPDIPEKYINKSSQWFILNREHAIIVTQQRIINNYIDMFAPEEVFFITTLFQHGKQNTLTLSPNISDKATTYTCWPDNNCKYISSEDSQYNGPNHKSPRNYTNISPNELYYLNKSKCLFGRKFADNCYGLQNSLFLKKKNLVFSSVGDKTNFINNWLSHKNEKNFDLWVIYYGKNTSDLYKDDVDYWERRKGSKMQNFHYIWNKYRDLILTYDRFFILDDDIEFNTYDINECFRISKQYNLWMLQPSFHGDSKISHKITKKQNNSLLRYSNFVEINTPLISKEVITDIMKMYCPSLTGWGIDCMMSHILINKKGFNTKKIAILDKVSCVNPDEDKKGGGQREIVLLQPNIVRQEKWQYFKQKNKITFDIDQIKQYGSI